MDHLLLALSQAGIKEIVGRDKNNPVIVNYAKEIGHSWVKDDETAWCSIFVNWVAMKSGLERSGKLNARSWLKVGEPVKEPKMGDVVVLWRESKDSWKGHVGFFIRETKNWIYILGGNQGNQVKTAAYRKDRLLEYRRLRKK